MPAWHLCLAEMELLKHCRIGPVGLSWPHDWIKIANAVRCELSGDSMLIQPRKTFVKERSTKVPRRKRNVRGERICKA